MTDGYKTARLAAFHAVRRLKENGNAFMAKTVEDSLSVMARPERQVEAFHVLYDMPIHRGPVDHTFSHMDEDRLRMRLGLILEEFMELLSACGQRLIETYANDTNDDKDEVTIRPELVGGNRDIIEAADALGDILYVVYGLALEMGVNIRDVFNEIHASNMTKLDDNGNVVKREDGKILKGDNYAKPNIGLQLMNLRRESK